VKRNVWLVQCNNLYGKSAFIPYSVGLLRAYAETFDEIKAAYQFQEFVFLREPIADVIRRMQDAPPDIVGCSVYIWNGVYTLALAKAVKEVFPQCLVVLGGPHVPVRSEGFFTEHPYADLLVHYEGEVTFAEILKARLNPLEPGTPDFGDYTGVQGISLRTPENGCYKTPDRARLADLSEAPSPYLTGVFDGLLGKGYDLLPTFESDRGCPYQCTFCLSGNSLIEAKLYGDDRFRQYTLERLERNFWFQRFCTSNEFVVRAYDWKTDQLRDCTASVKMTGSDKRLLRIKLADGSYIDATPDHGFLKSTDDKFPCYKEAWDLKAGDAIRAVVGDRLGYKMVQSVEMLPGRHDVYCLKVPETGWFIAGPGIATKNCDWGSAVYAKVRKFPYERLREEIEWFATNKTDLLYGADSNFAMYDAHITLAEDLAKAKQRKGYPKKFRAAYAKNSGERVFQVAKILHDAGMNKGVTLSFQSLNPTTLELVKRSNIKMDNFEQLIKKYNQHSIATYTELIIGLPGETYDTFAAGIDKLLNAGCHLGTFRVRLRVPPELRNERSRVS
jgi:radical SAM superfamily enzyme YgiQ (UPF0313 family)